MLQLQQQAGNDAVASLLGKTTRDEMQRAQDADRLPGSDVRIGNSILSGIERARHATGEARPTVASVQRYIGDPVVQRGLPVAVEALEVALTATIAVQEQSALVHGGLSYQSSKAKRFGDPPQPTDAEYSARVLWCSRTHPVLPNVYAGFSVHWLGNQYGEMGGAYVQLDMDESTEFWKSSLEVKFDALETMPKKGDDDRLWPMVWIYEGTFDPVGGGQYDFQGKFEIDAFGGFKVIQHKVVDRSWRWGGGPAEDYVQPGHTRAGSTPPPRPAHKQTKRH